MKNTFFIKIVTVLFFFIFSFSKVNSQCNLQELYVCDGGYSVQMSLFNQRFSEKLTNCFTPFINALLEIYAPDKLGDIAGPLSDLSSLPQLFDAAEAAQDCATEADEYFWTNWESQIEAWHECESDPMRGNCPDRAEMPFKLVTYFLY